MVSSASSRSIDPASGLAQQGQWWWWRLGRDLLALECGSQGIAQLVGCDASGRLPVRQRELVQQQGHQADAGRRGPAQRSPGNHARLAGQAGERPSTARPPVRSNRSCSSESGAQTTEAVKLCQRCWQ